MSEFRRAGSYVAVAVALVAVSSSWSADWDADAVKRYGGVYSTDCRDPSAPRALAEPAGLVVEVGKRRMTATNVQLTMTPYGNQEPAPGQEVVMLFGEVRGGHELSFWVHLDRSGQFVELQSDQAVAATLGKELLAQRFRDCDYVRSQRVALQAAAAVRADSKSGSSTRAQPGASRFKSVYLRALGARSTEGWLVSEVGRPTDDKTVTIDGTSYRVLTGCKPHDCGDNNALVLYAPSTDTVYGKIMVRRIESLIGAPPRTIAGELDRLWRAESRQGR
jgi:hypothetical protein